MADSTDEDVAAAVADADEGDQVRRCDYCRLPVSADAVTLDRDGQTYRFCSERCREAMTDADRVFTQYHGFRRTPTGVAPIDESLPQGVPRNSFVMLTDLAGTRTEAVRAELVWRALERGEPAVVVTFLEPPVSVVQEFVTLDWNVLPYLESGQLRFVDAFTYRMEDRDRMYDRLNDWNAHLAGFCKPATGRVRDPSDVGELANRVDDVLEDLGMEDRGVVVVDSLNEFGSLVQPVQAYRFVRNLRATVPKSRFVPVFASATVTGEGEGFPHDLDYLADGIVEMRLNDDLVEGSLMKQIRVRKMSGVLNLPKWVLYEYTAGEGIVTIEVHEGPPDDEDTGDDGATEDDDAGGESHDGGQVDADDEGGQVDEGDDGGDESG
ncbi:MAG: ATPase domain-containing protein [Haloarculaceae archaeon]